MKILSNKIILDEMDLCEQWPKLKSVFGKGNETFLSNQLVFILQFKFLICFVSFKKVNNNCFILSCTHLLIKISLKLENIFQLKNLTNFGHIEIPISGI